MPAMFERCRLAARLTEVELWWAYFALGGEATPSQFAGFLHGTERPGPLDHDRLAHALNERLTDLGMNSPVPYFADPPS